LNWNEFHHGRLLPASRSANSTLIGKRHSMRYNEFLFENVGHEDPSKLLWM